MKNFQGIFFLHSSSPNINYFGVIPTRFTTLQVLIKGFNRPRVWEINIVYQINIMVLLILITDELNFLAIINEFLSLIILT